MGAVVSYDRQERMAQSLVKSGLFGLQSVDQALALMAICEAEGRHPALIARDFHLIQGKAAKKSEAMLRDFQSAGGRVQWHQLDDAKADATFSHASGGEFRCTWDIARAAQAGLAGRDMWKKYPRAMLRSRCVSEGIRTVFPGATSGVYTPEEMQDVVIDETPASGPVDVTPFQPPALDEAQIADHLAAIAGAADLESLKSAFRTAYSEAKRAASADALTLFERAKDARKLELTAEDVP